jgi:hypothetical protein
VTFGRTPPSELSKDLLGANDCLSPREEAAPLRRNKTYALSFAQFERELIGERVRDKISASKRKGLWVGGPVLLGYAVVDKKILVVAAEVARASVNRETVIWQFIRQNTAVEPSFQILHDIVGYCYYA